MQSIVPETAASKKLSHPTQPVLESTQEGKHMHGPLEKAVRPGSPGKRLMADIQPTLSLRIGRSTGHIPETIPRLLARSTGDALLQAQPASPTLSGQYAAGTLLRPSYTPHYVVDAARGDAGVQLLHASAPHSTALGLCVCVCVCALRPAASWHFFFSLLLFFLSPIRHVTALLRQKQLFDVGTTILSAADHGDLSLRRPIPVHTLVIVRVVL